MSGLFNSSSPTSAAPTGQDPAASRGQIPSYQVLARKYRPTRFADLIGQDAMVRTLRNAFAIGRVAHAFMLSGVRGVGKTSTARIIARALNCIGPDGNGGPTAEPCGVCANCRAILAERHPDVVEMDAASRTGVDDVREIIEAVRFRPLEAREKVFIIDEVHMLSRNAFNALLKTLEEPPAHVTFIFATTELRKVPLTVLSRCQRFDLRRLSTTELVGHFGRIAVTEGVTVTPDALALLARAADGSVRDGLSLLDQAISMRGGEGPIDAAAISAILGIADGAATFDLFEALLRGQPAPALAIADQMYAGGTDPGLLLADLLGLTHTLSRLKAVPELNESTELAEIERTRGAALAAQLSVPVLGRAWQMLLKGVQEVESAPDRRAAADMVLIRLCYIANLPPPAELIRTLTDASGHAASVKPPAAPVSPHPAATSPRSAGHGPGHGRESKAVAIEIAEPPEVSAPAPLPSDFRAVVELVQQAGEPVLAAELRQHAHLVRFAPPVIELHPEPAAPRHLAQQLARTLQAASGIRWTIALSAGPGEPTLVEVEVARAADERARAAAHPLVAAILGAFPGATIGPVQPIGSTSDSSGPTLEVETPPEPSEEDA